MEELKSKKLDDVSIVAFGVVFPKVLDKTPSKMNEELEFYAKSFVDGILKDFEDFINKLRKLVSNKKLIVNEMDF